MRLVYCRELTEFGLGKVEFGGRAGVGDFEAFRRALWWVGITDPAKVRKLYAARRQQTPADRQDPAPGLGSDAGAPAGPVVEADGDGAAAGGDDPSETGPAGGPDPDGHPAAG